MKRLIVILLTMSSIMAFAQQLDGYNCIYLNSHTNNQWGLDDRIKASFENKGFKVVTSRTVIPSAPNERLATLELTYSFEIKYGETPFNFKLKNKNHRSSRAREFHPHPLTEPCVKVSPHTALHTQLFVHRHNLGV